MYFVYVLFKKQNELQTEGLMKYNYQQIVPGDK